MPGRYSLEAIHELRDRHLWWVMHQEMNMVCFAVELHEFGLEI
jgi:hypothetical protein